MYSSCIFCSWSLGRNEALETFPVGELVAFDAWKGRLWAVCGICGRWNLAPIEERWEAVEDAERQFRETRLRAHSENIGIAQLADGTRLVRVGEALQGELAAWRYGTELRERRRRYRLRQAFEATYGLLMPEVALLRLHARGKGVVYALPPEASAAGGRLLVRERNLRGGRIEMGSGGDFQVTLIPEMALAGRLMRLLRGAGASPGETTFSGRHASDLLARAMVRVNVAGAAAGELRRALATLERSGSVARILSEEAGGMLTLTPRRWSLGKRLQGKGADISQTRPLPASTLLALEMLLHEEAERRALEGELEGLKARWREAEEIAEIADTLLDPPRR
jgi:hypothetical protein